jgi:hypothetical protein
MPALQYRDQSPNTKRKDAINQLLRAREATEKISKVSLGEIKSFNNPSVLIMLCMNPVNVLFGRDPNWKATQKLLSEKKNLKDDMKNYDIS